MLKQQQSPATPRRRTAMAYLDLDTLASQPLSHSPYEHIVVKKFVKPDAFVGVTKDFPAVPGPGSHPPSELKINGHFKGLMDELMGDDFRRAIEQKFNIDLTGRPTMYTVRGFLRGTDGQVHTDSKTKIITVLVYLNEPWQEAGGKLRILKSDNVEDYASEIEPSEGTLLVFKRSDNSWHGHLPYEGPRRAIQLNWVTSQDVVDREQSRHGLSTRLKKIKSWLTPGRAA
jgi:SM-20-related protein